MNSSKDSQMPSDSILHNKGAFATPLLIYAYDIVGSELLDYDTETVRELLISRNPKVGMPLVNRLNAAIGLLNSNMFWVDPVTFGLVCRTLNRNPYVASEAPDLYDISWGVTEANLIMGSPDEDDQKNGDLMYSEAVKRYIQHLFRIDGIYKSPDSLDFVTPLPSSNTIDEPQQVLSVQERSDSDVAAIDYSVYVKTIECLNQIKQLDVALSKEASEELNRIIDADGRVNKKNREAQGSTVAGGTP